MDRLTARLRPARTVRLLLAGMLLVGAVTFLATRPAHAATSYRVVMSGYAFSPRVLTITAGSTVTWVNEDQAPHDVKTTSGPEPIHSPMLSKGGAWSHTFTLPGTYGYVCTVHPGMTAGLVVKAAAAPTPTTQPATHQHTGSLPAAAQPAQSPAPTAHAAHGRTAAAPSSGSPAASPAAAAAAAPTQQAAAAAESTASAARPLDPLLLLAGVVAGVAVLCLLLVGSRSGTAGARDGGTPSSN
ncbi:plastocyanin/azurin family copper-binding protein [Streptomyces sp. Li-HN-5-11]|uniref:cupredoxin domain-containing protein n=1 Tax=Streptomyces sp. Li-HN-5-11 TaxID=3075432 RepID=UPI0028AC7F59|nr:plastocyanin/azurin family copper-binding protein [Streptomyces sp. Li-HN-5-11]WNM29173.1 plastocyanin/azurin family copper-binding protein [Streptomyces sp. Li-HN-5-11]